MSNTVESLFEPGIQQAISSVSDYLNSISDYLSTQTRDELLGPELVHFAKGGPEISLLTLAFYADALRIVYDAMIENRRITGKETYQPESFLAKVADCFAKVRSQYAPFKSLPVSGIVPFLNQYRFDTGVFGYLNTSTKWSGLLLCKNLARILGDSSALEVLRETLIHGAKELFFANGIEEKEEFYLEKLEEVLHEKIPIPRPGQIICEMDPNLSSLIFEDSKDSEASSDHKVWISNNCSRIESWQKAAQANDPRGQHFLGLCYAFGYYLKQNYNDAFRWYRFAADQGYANAQNQLGDCYDTGEGVAEDKQQAAKWYFLAAEQGHASAQNQFGYCYYNGVGIAENKAEAFKWYRKSAEQGNICAQYNLGYCYDYGEGVVQDKAEAFKWYHLAAEQGDANAQLSIAYCYNTGEGVAEDKSKAFKWYRKSAEQGMRMRS